MLNNRHLVNANSFFKKRPNYGQTPMEKPLYNTHFYSRHLIYYSGHFFRAPREQFGQNLPLNSRYPMIRWEKENTCMFLFDTFVYFNMKLIIYIFQAIFHQVITLTST